MLFFDPIPARFSDLIEGVKPVLVLGLAGTERMLCVDGDGWFHVLPLVGMQSDYRFDPATKQWGDAVAIAKEEA